MTARRFVTLVCDKPGCRQQLVGMAGERPSEVRRRAAAENGWSSYTQSADMLRERVDLCRWHS